MAPARRLSAGVCAGLALLGAVPAFAQSDRPRKRPQPPPVTAPADTGNTTDDTAAASSPTLRPSAPAPPVLRSAVRSRWSRPAIIAHPTTGQCRAQCSVQRTSCATGALGAGMDASTCDPDWTRCLTACNGSTYSRGP